MDHLDSTVYILLVFVVVVVVAHVFIFLSTTNPSCILMQSRVNVSCQYPAPKH